MVIYLSTYLRTVYTGVHTITLSSNHSLELARERSCCQDLSQETALYRYIIWEISL